MNFVYRLKQSILLAGDVVAFCLGLLLALSLRQFSIPNAVTIAAHIPLFSWIFLTWVIINFINGLYDLGRLSGREAYRRLIESGLLSLAISVVILYLSNYSVLSPKTILVLNIICGYGLSALWRFIYAKTLAQSSLQTRIIFLGYSPEIAELLQLIKQSPEKGYTVAALFDPEHHLKQADMPGIDLYTSLAALRPAITMHKAQLVVTAQHLKEQPEILRELYELLFWPVRIANEASFYETITGRVPPSTFSDGWFISNLVNVDNPGYESLRRVIDYAASLVMAVTLLILGPIIAIAIKLTSPGSILFRQLRVGHRDTHFFIYKFRTMYSLSADGSAETAGAEFAQKDDKRITPLGKFLRKVRLDELPQCWNLLRGDITLIGPRPERPEIVSKLEAKMPYYTLRHLVKPGITGWAAINQHYTSTLDEAIQKLQYDLYYIKNRSLLLDVSILLRTVNVVLRMMGQ